MCLTQTPLTHSIGFSAEQTSEVTPVHSSGFSTQKPLEQRIGEVIGHNFSASASCSVTHLPCPFLTFPYSLHGASALHIPESPLHDPSAQRCGLYFGQTTIGLQPSVPLKSNGNFLQPPLEHLNGVTRGHPVRVLH